ncbi:MAG: T9SS type A sorting domain-containing protein [Bacteroidota bacterium]
MPVLSRWRSVALLAVLAISTAQAQPGALDPTFGVDGTLPVELAGADLLNVVPAPDGGLFVLGQRGPDAVVVRVLPEGQGLDPGFGVDGIASVDFGDGQEFVVDGAVTADGGLVVVGISAPPIGAPRTAALAKLDATGALAVDFADGGTFRLTGYVSSNLAAVRVLDGGAIRAIGAAVGFDGVDGTLALQLTSDGLLDATFGTAGLAFSPVNRDLNVIAAHVRRDGSAVLGGAVASFIDGVPDFDAAVMRLQPSGLLDTAFASDGLRILTTPLPSSSINDIALDGAGRIVGAGISISGATGARTVLVTRLLSNGDLDRTFGGDGLVTARGGATRADANGVAVQDDRSVVVVGSTETAGRLDLAVFKFDEGGTLDATFAEQGVAVLPREANEASRSGLLQPDGKVVALSTVFDATFVTTGFLLARFENDGRPVSQQGEAVPDTDVTLTLDGPNPFRAATYVRVVLSEAQAARVVVYDLTGRRVAVLHQGMLPAGATRLRLSAAGLASGPYIVQLQSAAGLRRVSAVRP